MLNGIRFENTLYNLNAFQIENSDYVGNSNSTTIEVMDKC